jgi:hypothetical protein
MLVSVVEGEEEIGLIDVDGDREARIGGSG